jgi:hypothetical protein
MKGLIMMQLGEMMLAARYANDPDYVEANRLFEEVRMESEWLERLVAASDLRVDAAFSRLNKAAISYNAKLKNENSCGVVWPSPCECDVGDCQ